MGLKYVVAICIIVCAFCNSGRAEWVQLKPLRQAPDKSVYQDIDSYILPSYNVGGMTVNYRDSDLITSSHECTHRINSEIRQNFKADCGIYLLRNKGFVIKKHPKITLKEIAEKIKKEERGPRYPLYMVEQRKYWNNEPLYILDEVSAYMHGASTGIEKGNKHRATESFASCIEMYYYGTICADLAKTGEYEYQTELETLNSVLYSRICIIKDQLEELGWLNDNHRKLLDRLQ